MADLNQSRFFSTHEFPNREVEVAFASQELFTALDIYRERLAVSINPSPVPGALSRFNGSETSQHFVAGYAKHITSPLSPMGDSHVDFERLDKSQLLLELENNNVVTTKMSTAIDIFVENPVMNFWKAYIMALSCGQFGGIGVYPWTNYDGEPHPMLHLDIRPHVFPTIWARDEGGRYIYPLQSPFQASLFLTELRAAVVMNDSSLT